MADMTRLWPSDLTHFQDELRDLHETDILHEDFYHGGVNIMLTVAFPPQSPHCFATRPQCVIRPPIATGAGHGTTNGRRTESNPVDSSNHTGNDPPDLTSSGDDSENSSSDTSIATPGNSSYNGAGGDGNDDEDPNEGDQDQGQGALAMMDLVMGEYVPQEANAMAMPTTSRAPERPVRRLRRGQQRSLGLGPRSVPDFIVDQQHGDRRKLVLVVEVKKSIRILPRDLRQLVRYAGQLRKIHNMPGQDLSNVSIMLVAGGRAITWDFGDWPSNTLNLAGLLGRPYVRAHEEGFLHEFIRIRDKAPYGWPPAPALPPSPLDLLFGLGLL